MTGDGNQRIYKPFKKLKFMMLCFGSYPMDNNHLIESEIGPTLFEFKKYSDMTDFLSSGESRNCSINRVIDDYSNWPYDNLGLVNLKICTMNDDDGNTLYIVAGDLVTMSSYMDEGEIPF